MDINSLTLCQLDIPMLLEVAAYGLKAACIIISASFAFALFMCRR